MSNFTMGTIVGKGFPQAQVQTVHSTSAEGTSAMNCMHECLWKTLSQDCPHGEVYSLIACAFIMSPYNNPLLKAKGRKKLVKL